MSHDHHHSSRREFLLKTAKGLGASAMTGMLPNSNDFAYRF